MPIQIEEDFEQEDGGYAILTLPGSIGDNEGGIRIKRLAGEPDKLGPRGWQPHDAVLKPSEVRNVAGKSTLYFGPELTQHLIEDTELEIHVVALKSTERVIWPYITPSVHADGGRGVVGGSTPTELTETAKGPGGQAGNPTGGGGTIEPGGGTTIVDPPKEEDEDPNEGSGFDLLWLVPIAAVAALIAYFIIPLDTETVVETDPIIEATDETDPIQDEEEVVEVAQVDTRESLMIEATECRDNDCDGEAFFDIANRLGEIGVRDLFAIMGLAADRGSVPAMEWLARAYDPLHFQAGAGLSAPEPNSAFGYYTLAADAGSEEANTAVQALCDALADPSEAGWETAPSEDNIRTAHERNCQ